MRCIKCHRGNGFLVRGLCHICAPELHARHQSRLDIIDDLGTAFVQESGKQPLANWYGFERFIETRADADQQRRFIDAFQEPPLLKPSEKKK